MTVQLDWPAEVIKQLSEEADKNGITLNEYVLRRLAPEAARITEDEGEEIARRRQEAVDRLLEVRKHVKPDPEGWTSKDYINYGRR